MVRVWLIRHAAPDTDGVDPGLSDVGRTQAMQVSKQLARRPLSAIWSSDSKRAMETAACIAARHGLRVETSAALREIDFGAWEGRPLRDLWSEDPVAARAWEADIRRTPATFAESVADLERRVERFWSQVRGTVLGGEVAVIGHRGSLAALRALITRQSFASSFAVPFGIAGRERLDA
jgi:broad specificity phosphatase PhoE